MDSTVKDQSFTPPYGFSHYMSPSFNFLYIAHNNVELFFGQASGFSTNFRESEIENTHFLGKSRNSYALAQGFSGCVGLPDILGKYNKSNRNALKLFYFLSIGAFVCHVCTGAQHTPIFTHHSVSAVRPRIPTCELEYIGSRYIP